MLTITEKTYMHINLKNTFSTYYFHKDNDSNNHYYYNDFKFK